VRQNIQQLEGRSRRYLLKVVTNSFHCLIPFDRDTSNVTISNPVTVEHRAQRGRPRKKVDIQFLHTAMNPKHWISISQLAKQLNIHCHTLRYYLKAHDVDPKFSTISDEDLDILVKTFHETKPDSGLRYLIGFLRQHGLRVQGEHVRASVGQVDKLGRALHR
jgi:hypothetical protein